MKSQVPRRRRTFNRKLEIETRICLESYQPKAAVQKPDVAIFRVIFRSVERHNWKHQALKQAAALLYIIGRKPGPRGSCPPLITAHNALQMDLPIPKKYRTAILCTIQRQAITAFKALTPMSVSGELQLLAKSTLSSPFATCILVKESETKVYIHEVLLDKAAML